MLIDPKPVQIEPSPGRDWARTAEAKGKDRLLLALCRMRYEGGMRLNADKMGVGFKV